MAEPLRPYYISFTHDAIPQQVDHSRSQPGPPGGAANRAGHTSVTSRPRLVIAWDNGPQGADGRLPIFAQSVNVYFRLTDFAVAISSDFARTSCAYRTTLRHELEAHIYDPIRIFHSYRDVLIRRLNAIPVPTRDAPVYVANSVEAQRRQNEIEAPIVRAIQQTRQEMVREMEQARDRHDAPGAYRLVYNQCTADEWASGR